MTNVIVVGIDLVFGAGPVDAGPELLIAVSNFDLCLLTLHLCNETESALTLPIRQELRQLFDTCNCTSQGGENPWEVQNQRWSEPRNPTNDILHQVPHTEPRLT